MRKAIIISAIISIVAGIVIIAGIVSIALSLIGKGNPPHSIIGGADGPTVIFLATHIGSGSLLFGLIAAVILVITGFILLVFIWKKGKNK